MQRSRAPVNLRGSILEARTEAVSAMARLPLIESTEEVRGAGSGKQNLLGLAVRWRYRGGEGSIVVTRVLKYDIHGAKHQSGHGTDLNG